MRKLILVLFILTFQSSYCQDYWKINTFTEHQDEIDIRHHINNISLKYKNFTRKILSSKDDELIKINQDGNILEKD